MKNFTKSDLTIMSYYKTSNYDYFVNTSVNREVNLKHVASLAESIKKMGLLKPLNVVKLGNKYHILDGGNRLAACKLAGVPVTFIVLQVVTEDNIVEVMAELNKQINWKDSDYVKGYAANGKLAYQDYEAFKSRYSDFKQNGIQCILAMDGGEKYTGVNFRNGEFVSGNLITSCTFTDDLLVLRDMGFKQFNNTKFIQALIPIWLSEKYNHNQLVKGIQRKTYENAFDGLNSIKLFKKKIILVYYHGLQNDEYKFMGNIDIRDYK